MLPSIAMGNTAQMAKFEMSKRESIHEISETENAVQKSNHHHNANEYEVEKMKKELKEKISQGMQKYFNKTQNDVEIKDTKKQKFI